MNDFKEPGFEDSGAAWTLADGAVVDGRNPFEGDASLVLPMASGSSDVPSATQVLDIPSGVTRSVKATIQYKGDPDVDATLKVVLNPGDGEFAAGSVPQLAVNDTWVQIDFGLWTPIYGASPYARFEALASGLGIGDTGAFYVDAVVGEQALAKSITTLIREALIADLSDINGVDPFRATLAAVYDTPQTLSHHRGNIIELHTAGGGGVDALETLHSHTGEATQRFHLKLYARSESPNESVERLMDDVRLATGREDSNLVRLVRGGDSTVQAPTVLAGAESWSDVSRHTESSGQRWGIIDQVVIEVRYRYDRNVV